MTHTWTKNWPYFLILHLKNYRFTNFHTYRYSMQVIIDIKHVAKGVARGQPMSWNPQNRLNSIGHISKTILNWFKLFGKLHTPMSFYTYNKNQRKNFFFSDLTWNDPITLIQIVKTFLMIRQYKKFLEISKW